MKELPRERAYLVAERLAGEGLRGDALLAELVRRGHSEAEARLAVASLNESARSVDRSAIEAGHKAAEERGYLALLFGAVCIGGGVLLVGLRDAVLVGGGLVALGAGVLLYGLAQYWSARGV